MAFLPVALAGAAGRVAQDDRRSAAGLGWELSAGKQSARRRSKPRRPMLARAGRGRSTGSGAVIAATGCRRSPRRRRRRGTSMPSSCEPLQRAQREQVVGTADGGERARAPREQRRRRRARPPRARNAVGDDQALVDCDPGRRQPAAVARRAAARATYSDRGPGEERDPPVAQRRRARRPSPRSRPRCRRRPPARPRRAARDGRRPRRTARIAAMWRGSSSLSAASSRPEPAKITPPRASSAAAGRIDARGRRRARSEQVITR